MTNKIDVSVIIPTLNRCQVLADLLDSLKNQKPEGLGWEVWVIDNGSTDNTQGVVKSRKQYFPAPLHYLYEPEPGLHYCRNRGAEVANGMVVAYLDDDMLLDENWINGARLVLNGQADLVGGKILPLWEVNPPDWIHEFSCYFSLLDLGPETGPVDGLNVIGCNCFVRRELVLRLKGYHPDSLPRELMRYRGDGETGFSLKAILHGLKSYYDPSALAYHRINAGRLTIDYICQISYRQGVSDSFTRIRAMRGLYGKQRQNQAYLDSLLNPLRFIKRLLMSIYSNLVHKEIEADRRKKQIRKRYREGFYFHQGEVSQDRTLREWVLRENYLGDNGKIPVKKG